MQDDDRDRGERWWRRGAQTRRHLYFEPTGNRQGVLLFVLIGVLGLAAAAVAGPHLAQQQGLRHADGVLGGIGLLCILLGFGQALRLARRSAGIST